MDVSFIETLYGERQRCLHTERYLIYDKVLNTTHCGPCYFREGILDELPTRINIREDSGLFGSPQFDPRFIEHAMISAGLVPPEPHQSLREFREQRIIHSQPSPKAFPFTSTLWKLMGYQPPLAKVLLRFCQGYREVEIAEQMDLSLYNVTDRLSKAVHSGQKMLRI